MLWPKNAEDVLKNDVPQIVEVRKAVATATRAGKRCHVPANPPAVSLPFPLQFLIQHASEILGNLDLPMLVAAEKEAKQQAAEGDSSSDDEDEDDTFVPMEPEEEDDRHRPARPMAVMRQASLPTGVPL